MCPEASRSSPGELGGRPPVVIHALPNATFLVPNQTDSSRGMLRPSSDVVLLPCRTKLQFGPTVARQEIYSDSDVVPESNQIQGLLEPRNNSPPNSPRERNLARTY